MRDTDLTKTNEWNSANMPQHMHLFAIGVDVEKNIRGLLKEIIEKTGAQRICIASFHGEGAAHTYCSKSDDCSHCGDTDKIVAFAKRMSALVPAMEKGGALIGKMTAEEKDIFRFHDPAFFTISYQGDIFGTLCCDRDAKSEWSNESLEFIQHVCDMLAVTFRNAAFYQSHLDQQEVLTNILENLDANIYVSDMDTNEILFINKKMREEFGLGEDCIGKLCWKVLQSGMSDPCEFCPAPLLKAKPGTTFTWEECNTATGMYYRNTDSIIAWLDGRPVHLQHSVNITDEKKTNQNLEEAKKMAESANQAKSDFLSRMSHEIRTPINAVIGMTRIAKSSDDMQKVQECLEKIDLSSKQLLTIINDILDMSKISANKMTLSEERFDFERMLINISNIITSWSGDKNQKLHIHMDIDMPRYYVGDELRLSQVITNLLSNAVKFTPEHGKIRVDIKELNREESFSTIEVAVTDSGIGIAPQNQRHLFTSFEQADGGIARKFGGTGLGLAICKSIVEMMGGGISVQSKEGKGSTFTFTVKLKMAEQEDKKAPFNGLEISKLRVLLIDDEEETRDYFTQIMDEFKVTSDTAQSCVDGMALMKKAQAAGTSYNIVFVDWHMPDIDGIETLKRIKQEFKSCIVIMVTVGEWGEVEQEAKSAGAFRFLSKPLFPSTLLDTINEFMGVPQKQDGYGPNSRVSFAGYTILLVEDAEINREIVKQDLSDTRVTLDYAENGQIAVDMFRADPQKYDLILMDIHMDIMDGYEATKHIRALDVPRASTIPILAMTANAFQEDIEKCLQAGMNDHIAKPIDLDNLFSKLSYYLTKYEEPAPEQPEETLQEVKKEMQTEGMEQYINVDEALGRLRGNKTVYKTLLKSFAKNESWDQLCAQLEAGDLETAQKSAHAIKGMAGNLSLTEVYNVVVLLEAQLKSGFAYEESFEKLKDAMAKTLEYADALIETL